MNKRVLVYIVSGALVIGGVVGLGMTRSTIAKAAAADQTAAAADAAGTGAATTGDQSPTYTSSIQVPNAQDTQDKAGNQAGDVAENSQANESAGEATEAAGLQALAKITPDQAKAAALQAVPGTASKVELDNENGNLVYSVEVKTANGDVDVKVDAGNGTILAQDSQHEDGDKGDQGQDNEKASGAPDTDNVQEQSEN